MTRDGCICYMGAMTLAEKLSNITLTLADGTHYELSRDPELFADDPDDETMCALVAANFRAWLDVMLEEDGEG